MQKTTWDKNIEVPEAITPEELLHGYKLPSLNIITGLQSASDEQLIDKNFDPINKINEVDEKLKKVRGSLIKMYNEEFIPSLISQAISTKDRYKKV